MSKRYLMKIIYESRKFFKDTFMYLLNHPGGINREVTFKETHARNECMLLGGVNY